jgi:ornithine decarboxylase
VLCVVPGEVWGGAVQRYFLALEEGINLLPGFSPELQGFTARRMPTGLSGCMGMF